MKRLIAAALLALGAVHAAAGPLVFTDTTWSTSTFSSAGGVFNSANDSSLIAPLPLATSSPSADLDATASGDALADTNVLSALATAIASQYAGASASASSEFLGNFISPGGRFNFFLDIDTSATSSLGDGSVRVTLVSGADRLIDEIVRRNDIFNRYVDLAIGTPGFVNIEAIGTADAVGLGDIAVGSATVTFGVNRVPEPAGGMLLAGAALAALVVARRPLRGSRA